MDYNNGSVACWLGQFDPKPNPAEVHERLSNSIPKYIFKIIFTIVCRCPSVWSVVTETEHNSLITNIMKSSGIPQAARTSYIANIVHKESQS